ncbi:MAG: ABC transporter ATP-binding protein [Actinomycetes bacterium]
MTAEGLDADLRVRRDAFTLDVRLVARPGEVVALLGPNGAGKSTALRALAGLLPLDAGHVRLDGRPLDDPAVATFVPPQRRGVGMVFQDHLLFAHLDATENVAFGLRARGVPRHQARARARAWLGRVGLAEHAAARPDALSGGQSQRVALARALVTEPGLLLLDEPLAALDASTRVQVRSELRHHLADYPGCAVLVTHDALDAMVLADRLVVLEAGRVVQDGAPPEVARAPRTDFVARLVGLNLYRGTAGPEGVALDGGGALSTSDPCAGEVFVAFPPAAVALHRARPDGSPRNAWPGRVVTLEQHAETVRVRLAGVPDVLADVTPAAVADLDLRVGSEVWAAVKATEVRGYPA